MGVRDQIINMQASHTHLTHNLQLSNSILIVPDLNAIMGNALAVYFTFTTKQITFNLHVISMCLCDVTNKENYYIIEFLSCIIADNQSVKMCPQSISRAQA